MQCGKCKYKQNIGNTKETGAALCTRSTEYFPVQIEDDCYFIPQKRELVCGDCAGLREDFGCFAQSETDSAYQDGDLCMGFIDLKEQEFKEILMFWKVQKLHDRAEIEKMVQEVDEFYNDIEFNQDKA